MDDETSNEPKTCGCTCEMCVIGEHAKCAGPAGACKAKEMGLSD